MGLVCFAGAVSAQEPAEEQSRNTTAVLSAKPAISYPVVQVQQYLPAAALQKLFETDRKGVLLSREEFQKLVQQSEATTEPAAEPLIAQCRYAARISGDQLLISVTADLEQFRSGWQNWSFPLPRLSIETARVDGQPAIISRVQNQELTLATRGAGRHLLELEFSTELVAVGSDRVAAFALLPCANARLSLPVDAGKRLFMDGAEVMRTAPLDQPVEYRLSIGGKPQVQLRLTDRSAERTTDILTLATSGYGLIVAPGEVSWHVLTQLQVFGKPIDRLTFLVPKVLEVADVEASGLSNWTLEEAADVPEQTRITLTFGQAFEGARKIAIRGVMPVASGDDWDVPPLIIENVTSHVGQILVQHPSEIRLLIKETDGVRRATEADRNVSDMPEDMPTITQVKRHRFDIWREKFHLRLSMAPREQELQTAIASVLSVATNDVTLQAALTLSCRHAPQFDVDLDVPADWAVTAITGSQGEPVVWSVQASEPATNRLRILLPTTLTPGQLTTLLVHLRRNEGWASTDDSLEFSLPELRVPRSALVETTMVIQGDESLELTVSDLKGLDTLPLKDATERLRFQSQEASYSASVTVHRRPSELAVEWVQFYRLDHQQLAVHLFGSVQIQGGGVTSLVLTLPESTPDSLRFRSSGPTIVEQSVLGVQNGRRAWELRFADRIQGVVPLEADFVLPRDEQAAVLAPLAELAKADRSHGVAVIEAAPDQRLQLTGLDAQRRRLDEMDAHEIPAVDYQPKERIIGVFRLLGTGQTLEVKEERFEKAAIPNVIATELAMTSVVSQSGELQQKSVFHLILAGVQQFVLQLPEESELWSVLLNEQPVEVRRSEGRLLISLPANLNGDSAAELTLMTHSHLSPLTSRGTISQTAPILFFQNGTENRTPVEVLKHTWNLVHPQQTFVIHQQGSLEASGPLDHPGWISRLLAHWRWPTSASLQRSGIALGILAVVLIAVLLLMRRVGAVHPAGVAVLLLMIGMGTAVVVKCAGIGTYGLTVLSPPTAIQGRQLGESMVAEGDSLFFRDGSETQKFMDENAKSAPAKPGQPALDMLDDNMSVPTSAATPTAAPVTEPTPEMPMAAGAAGARPPREPNRAAPLQKWADQADAIAKQKKSPQGMLSLSLLLERPANSVEKEFVYVGSTAPGTAPTLTVDYISEKGGTAYRVFAFVTGILIGWILRRCAASTKLIWLLAGVVLSVGLVPSVAASWQLLCDAVLIATAAMAAIWCFWGTVQFLMRLSQRVASAVFLRSAASMVLAISLGSSATGAEEPQPRSNKTLPPVVEPAISMKGPVLIYDDATRPLEAHQVFVPWNLYLDLFQRAHGEWKDSLPYSGPAKVIDAQYVASLLPAEGSRPALVALKGRLTISNPHNGAQEVSLPLQQQILKSARLNDQPAAILTTQKSWSVVVSQTGLSVLDLEWTQPLTGSIGAGSWSVILLPTPAGRLVFQLPDSTSAVRVNGSTRLYRRVVDDKTARIEFPIDAGGELQVAWQPEQSRGGDAMIHLDSSLAVSLDDAGVRTSLGLHYLVRQGSIQDVSVQLPELFRLQTVSGPDVGGWELTQAGAERQLRIFLRRNVSDATQLTIDGLLGQNAEQELSFDVPAFVPLGITTEKGTVSFYAPEGFRARADQAKGLTQIDARSFESAIPVTRTVEKPQLAYRFVSRPYELRLKVSRLETQVEATVDQGTLVTHRKLKHTLLARFELSKWPRTSLSLQVPADWLVLDVQAAGLTDWYRTVDEAKGLASVTVELEQPRQGTVSVVLTATQDRDPDSTALPLTVARVPGARRQTSRYALWLEPGFSVNLSQSGKWRGVDPTQIPDSLKDLQTTPAALAFINEFNDPEIIELTVTRTVPRLSASSLTVMTVTDVATVYGCIFQWQIERAATDILVVDVPVWLSDRLRFESEDLREVTKTSLNDQTTRWTIHLRQPVSGTFRLAASASLPMVEERVRAPGFQMLSPSAAAPVPVSAQQHYVLLINTSLSQLTSTNSTFSEPVQKAEVDLVIRPALIDQATEFVRLRTPGQGLEWTRERYLQSQPLPAAVNLAHLVTVVARDGSYRSQVTYTLRNRSRQFLALQLPEATRLLSVVVADVPSRGVMTTLNQQPTLLIPLPKTSAVDLSFPVKLIFSGQLKGALPQQRQLARQDIEIPAPVVVSQEMNSEYGIPVARTQWRVYLPDDTLASPLKDPLRHNMNLTSEETDTASALSILMSDSEELLSSVSSLSSYGDIATKRRALTNMKKLDAAMDYYFKGSSAADPQQQARLKEQVSQLEKNLQEESTEIPGLNVLSPQRVRPTEESKEQLTELLRGRVSGGDASVQLGRALVNNSAIILDNGNGELTRKSFAKDQFSLSLPVAEDSPDQPMKSAKPLADKKGIKGEPLEARQLYQKLNEQQLDGLKQQEQSNSLGLSFQQGNFSGSGTGMGGMGGGIFLQEQERMGRRNRFQAANGPGNALPAHRAERDQPPARPQAPNLEARFDVDEVRSLTESSARPGMLSLTFDIPSRGTNLNFTKAGGEARLALRTQSAGSLQYTMGLVWSAFCAVIVILLITATRLRRYRLIAVRAALWCALLAAGVLAVVAPFLVQFLALMTICVCVAILAWLNCALIVRASRV